jgi:hypothetical protein|tara:strand:+ start:442 stop:597 length:156 start_codon:yes stop_codon:yes gene_type:complete
VKKGIYVSPVNFSYPLRECKDHIPALIEKTPDRRQRFKTPAKGRMVNLRWR